MIIAKTHKDLKDVLMDPSASGIKDTYYVIPEGEQNITILSPGKNGAEFNKTHGHFHKGQTVETFICVLGQGLLIMQRNDELGEAKEFKVVSINSGKQVTVPAGFGHALINLGRNFLIVSDTGSLAPQANNYKEISEKRGFAYYVIEKKGDISFEPNPNYKVHPQITTE